MPRRTNEQIKADRIKLDLEHQENIEAALKANKKVEKKKAFFDEVRTGTSSKSLLKELVRKKVVNK